MPVSSRPLRVAVVNDYAVVVAGVAAMLAPYPERVVVVELDVRRTPVADVDVVLLDTFGQTREGVTGLAELVDSARAGGAVVVGFSWSTDRGAVQRSLTQGAAGHVGKDTDAESLLTALEAAYAGQTVVPPGLDQPQTEGGWPGRDVGLTAREAEVISLITQGLGNQDIAVQCHLSINSVKTYIRTAYRKMGVTRRSQAVLWGLAHGFAPDRP